MEEKTLIPKSERLDSMVSFNICGLIISLYSLAEGITTSNVCIIVTTIFIAITFIGNIIEIGREVKENRIKEKKEDQKC
jgi:hypothetical protein